MSVLSDINDNDLMTRVQAQDHKAFETLVRRHTGRFYACAYRYVHHMQTAEDIVQEAFVKLWRKSEHWNPDKGAQFTTWFTRVVTNTALDTLRKAKPDITLDTIGPVASDDNIANNHAMNEQQRLIEQAVYTLPERQKTALNLCFYEQLSNKDAAETMGVGVKALESLLMRAKSSVRTHLICEGVMEESHAG